MKGMDYIARGREFLVILLVHILLIFLSFRF